MEINFIFYKFSTVEQFARARLPSLTDWWLYLIFQHFTMKRPINNLRMRNDLSCPETSASIQRGSGLKSQLLEWLLWGLRSSPQWLHVNPLNAELNSICYLLALLAQHFLHVSRIRVKSLTLRLLMSYIYIYIYGAPILDISRSHTTTQHSR